MEEIGPFKPVKGQTLRDFYALGFPER
jgi:hypothetical protein